jgi:DNA polymerase (family 10)
MARDAAEVVRALDELARLTTVDEADPNSFRVRAYQNAARAVAGLGRDVTSMTAAELAEVRGIGRSTAAKIHQFVTEGRIDKLEALRTAYPPGQLELLRVPGLGPKTVRLLADVLEVRDLDGLRRAIAQGRLADLPGMGDKTQRNLAEAVERAHAAAASDRRPSAAVMPVAEALVAALGALPEVDRVAYAGSLRRFRDTVGDLDLLVAARTGEPVMAALSDHHSVHEVRAQGPTKATVVTWDGLQIDLRVVEAASFGAALIYFTGSKAHNIRLRQRAIERGWTLSEYALTDPGTDTVVAAATEPEVYAALDLGWIPTELREDDGEIELAADGALPRLLELDDLRGDLHDHTTYSGDGRDDLETMVAAAAARGFAYFAVTDHAENLTINGVSRAGMLEQRTRLRELARRHPDLHLLHGAELNIGVDGTLDYDDEFLASFDWCVASVHSAFRRGVAEQTDRVVRAIHHPAVTAIGHLSGRMLGRRDGIDLDLDRVFEACIETGTALEINSNLRRLDATDAVIREGGRRGVRFVVSTDAHTTGELDNHRFGVRQARRGRLPHDLVVNTWDTPRFLAWIADVRAAGTP